MRSVWKFDDGSEWQQDPEGLSFALKKLGGTAVAKPTALPLMPLLGAKRQHCAQGAQVSFLPKQFDHCPTCGARLPDAGSDPNPLWLGPYGALNNTRTTSRVLDPSCREAAVAQALVPNPFGADCRVLRFVVARLGGQQRMLFALHASEGEFAVCNMAVAQPAWHKLGGHLGAAELPEWALGVAANCTESHVALPSEGGLAWVAVDWSGFELKAEIAPGRCLSGPAVLPKAGAHDEPAPSDLLCAPMRKLSGEAVLLWRSSGSLAYWNELPIPGLPSDVQELGLAQRVRARHLAWPGRSGRLLVEHLGDQAPSVRWQPWPNGLTGLPELGPAWLNDGKAWQSCKGKRPSAASGKPEPYICLVDLHTLELGGVCEQGEMLTTGYASFCRHYNHWRSPLEALDHDAEQPRLRLPLLQFAKKSSGAPDPKGMVLWAHIDSGNYNLADINPELLGRTHSPGLRFALELAGKDLGATALPLPTGVAELKVSRLAQLQVCYHDSHLWLYVPNNGQLLRWRLPLASD